MGFLFISAISKIRNWITQIVLPPNILNSILIKCSTWLVSHDNHDTELNDHSFNDAARVLYYGLVVINVLEIETVISIHSFWKLLHVRFNHSFMR